MNNIPFLTPEVTNHLVQHFSVSVALWIIVIAAILIDLWDGVYTAKAMHIRIHSHKLRITVGKISEYWRLMLIGFCVDTVGALFPAYSLPYLSVIFCVGLVCVEAKSMFEHARKRKSNTVEVKDMIRMIIDCTSEGDAKSIISRFGEYIKKSDLKTTEHEAKTDKK